MFLDEGEVLEIGAQVMPEDPLRFKDSKRYRDRLASAQKTGEHDALVAVAGKLLGVDVVACAFDPLPRRLDGLGGRRALPALGQLLHRAPGGALCFRRAAARACGGALRCCRWRRRVRRSRLAREQLPFISVMTDPTTGGVSASLAMLGDLNVAEPRALIGFAGPRVIQQTVRETLPEGFQRSEFLLEHGALDMIVDRRDMRERLGAVIRLLLKLPPAATVA